MVEKLASSGSPSMPTIPTTLTQNLPMPTLTSVTVPVPPALTTAVFASHSSAEGSTLTMPDPKRVCLEPGIAGMYHVHRQRVVVDNLILWGKGHESATTLHMYEW